MKKNILAGIIIFFTSCNYFTQNKSNAVVTTNEKISFFPVTSYIKGQIHDIKEKGITPFFYTTSNSKTDSIPVKFEQLDSLLTEFLHPQIDTYNLISFFTEYKFLDKTINAYTFTYDAKQLIPDSILLRHWDIYVNPETNTVNRIYIVKKSKANKNLQLTWQSNQWCKITTIATDKNGKTNIEKEEKICWAY